MQKCSIQYISIVCYLFFICKILIIYYSSDVEIQEVLTELGWRNKTIKNRIKTMLEGNEKNVFLLLYICIIRWSLLKGKVFECVRMCIFVFLSVNIARKHFSKNSLPKVECWTFNFQYWIPPKNLEYLILKIFHISTVELKYIFMA